MNVAILPLHPEDFRPISLNERRALDWPRDPLPAVGDVILMSLVAGGGSVYRVVTDVNGQIVSFRPMHSTEKAALQK